FLLSIPVILGAFVFKINEVFKIGGGENIAVFMTGLVSSFVAGFIAILFLINFVKKHSFLPFVIYRILLGLTIVVLFLRA
ncbi:MAG TPA: undecaprenyl-diphosphate phosphatase, partial [Candidatus Goldiibacteriota bacterium]|nr:undecaprenyl-diphosphate phosphatase [Candidatus Goldiibacteriota bacterium]